MRDAEDAADVQLLLRRAGVTPREHGLSCTLSPLVTVCCVLCLRHIISCAFFFFFLRPFKEILQFPQII